MFDPGLAPGMAPCVSWASQAREGRAQLSLPDITGHLLSPLRQLVLIFLEHSKIISAGVLWVHICPMASQGGEGAVLFRTGL